MALPFDHPALRLSVLIGNFFVFKHEVGETIPTSVSELLTKDTGKFLSVTRTAEEISIVGEWQDTLPEFYQTGRSWKCIQIAGPMEFSLTGIINVFTTPLKAAEIPVFVVSTWNTDYVLVNETKLDAAVEVLKGSGWMFGE